ncbi:glycosyltransferase family 1 protein [Corynebacterium gallinarum]|uniref:glycogen phosphorylase n=1 Tax=Corynebacterium gallinarum TaxID=2762214 RepID=A0A8I0HP81_9CORY|nr:glycosyltransferase family 1 protein [Corynebacterium gallinarum]MBD8028875.1 glycosyltransferase family 1 protein [Corynebacterium gallinarum]
MKSVGTVKFSNQLPTQLEPLVQLAHNLRWSWREETKQLFRDIDPELWAKLGEDPKQMLHQAPASRLRELADDDEYLGRINNESQNLSEYLTAPLWYQKTCAESERSNTPITAYFSMEFGIHPSLPIYSGGLGVLAGDHMKSASDLGVPLIGVGLLYTHGYFTQSLTSDGWQQEKYEYHDPANLPIVAVTDDKGEQLKVTVAFPEGRQITIALWVANVGRVPLLLLDTNIDENPGDMRSVTDRLYGGDSEHRIKQEIVLGVGGIRAVVAYCEAKGIPRPDVAHLNEGHAGFLTLERIRQRMAQGMDYAAAFEQVRASNIFTTHTPVPAGIDRFDMSMVRRYLGDGLPEDQQLCPGIPLDKAIDLGREDDPSLFNMAHMGLRASQHANGVAKLHGEVSREMFASLYPGYEPAEVPIGHVTNGVHLPTWVKPEMMELIERVSGGADLAVADTWSNPDAVPNEKIWEVRNKLRADLVEVARDATFESWATRGHADAQLGWTRRVLDPEVLTIGFARRVSTYKRLTLMLRNPERLRSILLNEERPVQFVIAGKAHPHDMGGKKLMQEIVQFADQAGVRDRFLFLPDYDINLASYLVAGTDVWLNNPVRPQEASGTSGMKAVMNGGLTLSISDGWWDEMPQQETGWTIPTVETPDFEYRDHLESQALYDLLENDVAPLFYDRDDNGIPQGWLEMIRRSWTTLSPMVTSTRMVRDYTTDYYRPTQHQATLIAKPKDAGSYASWLETVKSEWSTVALSNLRVADTAAGGETHADTEAETLITVDVDPGSLRDKDIRVQAVVGDQDDHGQIVDPVIYDMEKTGKTTYTVAIHRDLPGTVGYTARVVPCHEMLVNAAETGLITYYHA